MNIKNELNLALNEKDVENIYRKNFLNFLGKDYIIESPFGCDGYLRKNQLKGVLFQVNDKEYLSGKHQELKILFEFKYDEKLEEKNKRIPIILQSIYYLKKFELNGKDGAEFPNVLFVGDKDQAFILHTNNLQKYLEYDLDWNLAPSDAYKFNSKIISEMMEDENLDVHPLYITNTNFETEIIKNILALNSNIKPQIRITEHNLNRVFDEFITYVIKEKYIKVIEPEILVGVFIGCIVSPDKYYKHPRRHILVIPEEKYGNMIEINPNAFKAFYELFGLQEYSLKEKRMFTSIQDRLIEDLTRRKNGEYFTPTNWVDEGIEMLDDVFGTNWKEDYVVWDCACGTKNLTRDYSFNNLYSSTLINSDLEISKNYNKKNVSFQYDFLNDDIELITNPIKNDELEEKLKKLKLNPTLIKKIITNEPILIYINPPYGTANSDGAKGDGKLKKGMAQTKVNEIMKNEKMGNSAQQLYAQFLFKITKIKEIYNLTNVNLAIYSPSIFLSGPAFEKFRDYFLKHFEFKSGMLFDSKHFADVSSGWGISFTIWKSGETLDKNNFIHQVKEVIDGEIQVVSEKNIYNTDGEVSLSEWMKKDVLKKYKEKIDGPQLTSSINVSQIGEGKLIQGCLGYFNNIANNIYQSEGGVGLFSSAYKSAHGFPIMPEYVDYIIPGFVGRRLAFSMEDWKNQKDELLPPNENLEIYKQYYYDSFVLAIFNPKAKVSSLRNILYKGESYNVINHFFFLSKDTMKELAEEYNNEELYEDILEFSKERFFYKKIEEFEFSPLAKEVLDLAKELTIKSFSFRKILANEFSEYNLNTWDAGWYQIKFILEKYYVDEYKIFDTKYKELFNFWKEKIYELGFLKK